MKKFTFLFAAIIFLFLPCLRSFADVALLDTEKNKLQLSGFFKLDAVYQDGGVNGLTFPRYAVAGDGNSYLTVSHSRFGIKYAGTPMSNGMNVSAVLELDFFDMTSANQMKFRFRQGFFSLQKDKHTVLFGQTWDLFSPLGPTTLMTNGHLWQTGNLGFRHAQIRYAFSGPHFDFAVALNDPATIGGWKNKMPVLQSRLGLKLGANNKFQFGLSGIYGRENAENTVVTFKNKVNLSGLGLDYNLAICKHLSLKGEYAMGENLAYVSSRSAWYVDLAKNEFAAKKVSAFWSELLLTKNKFSGWIGYAFEDLNAEEQLFEIAVNEMKRTNCVLAGVQYAAGSGVSFGLEFTHFISTYSFSGKVNTNQLIFSAILSL